jgi:hypothetical protein
MVSGRRGSAERETSMETDMGPRCGAVANTKKPPDHFREPLAVVTAKLSLFYSVVDVRAPRLPVVNQ